MFKITERPAVRSSELGVCVYKTQKENEKIKGRGKIEAAAKRHITKTVRWYAASFTGQPRPFTTGRHFSTFRSALAKPHPIKRLYDLALLYLYIYIAI